MEYSFERFLREKGQVPDNEVNRITALAERQIFPGGRILLKTGS